MRRSWVLSLLFLSLATGRSNAQTSAELEVIQTLEAMWASIEAGDADTYATYVHPDFSEFGEFDTYLSEGKDLAIAGMRDYLGRATGVHTDMHQPEVTVRGDVAWITYYWTDSGYADGKRFTSRGKSTRIFVREEGRWLCIHGHYTAVS
ncbi:MAG: DUF4440 domain-containing protein [Gemmatimonadota bacterium]